MSSEKEFGGGLASEHLTLRDYFAAKAMNGMLNDYDWETERFVEKLAVHAYIIADAMLKERDKS